MREREEELQPPTKCLSRHETYCGYYRSLGEGGVEDSRQVEKSEIEKCISVIEARQPSTVEAGRISGGVLEYVFPYSLSISIWDSWPVFRCEWAEVWMKGYVRCYEGFLVVV